MRAERPLCVVQPSPDGRERLCVPEGHLGVWPDQLQQPPLALREVQRIAVHDHSPENGTCIASGTVSWCSTPIGR